MSWIEQRVVAPDITVLKVSGRITAGHRIQELAHTIDALMQANARRVIIDLSAAELLDSTGLGMLVMYAQNLKHTGGHMRIAGASGLVEHTLVLCKVSEVVPLLASVDDAARSFANAAGAS